MSADRPMVCMIPALIAMVASATLSARATADDARTLYITPTGAGSQDGSSWSDAGTLARLPAFVARAGPDGKVVLRADLGVYRTTGSIAIRNGGTAGHPVSVLGVDAEGRQKEAQIVGTRADPYSSTGAPGSEVFRLLSGANHLRFAQLSFRNQGNGCFRIGADIRDLLIERVSARNVRRFIENYAAGRGTSASVDGLTVRDVEVSGFSKGAIRLQYDTRNVVLDNIEGDSERQDLDNFAEGVALEGTVHDVTMRRVAMRNSHDTLHAYWNGDGFTTEKDTYRIRFEDTIASGNTDAGYDLKSSDTVLVRTVAEDNKHNYKLWGRGVRLSDCIGKAPRLRGGTGVQDQVEVLEGADVTISNCRFADADPATTVFHVERGARLNVMNANVSKHADARMSLIDEGGVLVIK